MYLTNIMKRPLIIPNTATSSSATASGRVFHLPPLFHRLSRVRFVTIASRYLNNTVLTVLRSFIQLKNVCLTEACLRSELRWWYCDDSDALAFRFLLFSRALTTFVSACYSPTFWTHAEMYFGEVIPFELSHIHNVSNKQKIILPEWDSVIGDFDLSFSTLSPRCCLYFLEERPLIKVKVYVNIFYIPIPLTWSGSHF